MNFFEKVYTIVRGIPCGSVMSYGQVAELAGNSRMARQVGWALHACRPEDQIPWHRVIAKDGSISVHKSFGVENPQRELLKLEGVRFDEKGRVMKEFFVSWRG